MEENFSSVKEMVEWLNLFALTQDDETRDKLIEISLKLHGMDWMLRKESSEKSA